MLRTQIDVAWIGRDGERRRAEIEMLCVHHVLDRK
jgi:hypothetical protein